MSVNAMITVSTAPSADQVAQPVEGQHPVVDRLVGAFKQVGHDQCSPFSASSMAANSSSGAPETMWWRL